MPRYDVEGQSHTLLIITIGGVLHKQKNVLHCRDSS